MTSNQKSILFAALVTFLAILETQLATNQYQLPQQLNVTLMGLTALVAGTFSAISPWFKPGANKPPEE
jgi:uncharacterized membrane protein HdeD (DUF308 family)